MTLVSLLGDCTTTTAVALASRWPADDDVVLVELDADGGSLAAWLDTPVSPSLSTLVAAVPDGTNAAPAVQAIRRSSPTGLHFVAAPVRAREARRVVAEAEPYVVAASLADHAGVVLADLGRWSPVSADRPAVNSADVVVVVHRQEPASVAAATVRLDRLAETIDAATTIGPPVVAVLVGDRPFDQAEVRRFVSLELPAGTRNDAVHWHGLPVDPLAAAVYAGRPGVSARRLARLPLARAADDLARLVRTVADARTTAIAAPTGEVGPA